MVKQVEAIKRMEPAYPERICGEWSWSTVLTYFNGSRFIAAALNSVGVALQRLIDRSLPGHHLEVVIVDDCSLEGESAKLRDIVERAALPACCDISIVRLDANRGVSAARYQGLRRTRRSLIHIMDQDDEVGPDFYASVVSSYFKMKVDGEPGIMWIAGSEYIDAQNRVMEVDILEADGTVLGRLNSLDRWLSAGSQVRTPGMVVLSPSLHDRVLQYFGLLDRSADGSDDYWMFVYLLKSGAHFLVAQELGFRYRGHERNQSVGHDFLDSAQRGLAIMNGVGLLSPREYAIVADRYRIFARLEQPSMAGLARVFAYLSSPCATWRLLRARLK